MKPRTILLTIILLTTTFVTVVGTSIASFMPINKTTTPSSVTASGSTIRVSLASNGMEANDRSGSAAISDDGLHIAFESFATNLVANDTNNTSDIYVHDINTRTTTRISMGLNDEEPNDYSLMGDISADGRYIVFSSMATNLINNDTNGLADIFVYDRVTTQTTRVSISSNGNEANASSGTPSISSDGRFVAFNTTATNLVENDTNGKKDCFVHDRDTGTTERVSMAANGNELNNICANPSISGNGRFVVFDSAATNVVDNDGPNKDVFIRDRTLQATYLVSVDSFGGPINGSAFNPRISEDGRVVSFESNATDLVENGESGLYIRDRILGENKFVIDNGGGIPSLSNDGNHVVFGTDQQLVLEDNNTTWDVYTYDHVNDTVYLVTKTVDGTAVGGAINEHNLFTISGNGRYVALYSIAPNLICGDTNNEPDIFVHDKNGELSQQLPTPIINPISNPDNANNYTVSWSSVACATSYELQEAYNWGSWSQVDIGGENTLEISGKSTGEWCYSVRALNNTSSSIWSEHECTTVDSIADIGFRPQIDGYSFPNYTGSSDNDFTFNDMRHMFGDEAVCQMVASICIPKPQASEWLEMAHEMVSEGHCDGFTITSLRFFNKIDLFTNFQSDVTTTYELEQNNIRSHIAYYWILQIPNPVSTARNQALQMTPSEVLDQLINAMSNGASDPTNLIVYNSEHTSGHSITPYSIEDRGNGVYWVLVYDNNHPDDANRHVEINATNETWSYDLGWITWSGDDNSHSLGAIPISVYAQEPTCPWCNTNEMQAFSQVETSQTWLNGPVPMLFTDSQGRRIGYIGDQFINEIPSAYKSDTFGGLGTPIEPIYSLPITDTYTILLDGQTLTKTEKVSLAQFGPGYASSVSDIELTSISQDTVTFSANGKQLDYSASSSKSLTLTLGVDNADTSYLLQVQQADIGSGQTVNLNADFSKTQFSFSHMQAGNDTYTLHINRLNSSGNSRFLHAGINVNAHDTHYFDFGSWDGKGDLTFCKDYSSDGTFDDCEMLQNESQENWNIFLPSIINN